MSGPERVAITACGVVSPLGVGLEAMWRALLDGRSAVGPVTAFDTAGLGSDRAAEVRDFDPHAWLAGKPLRGMSRSAHLACTAAALALGAAPDGGPAGAPTPAVQPLEPRRVGLVAGTAFGNVHSMVRFDRETWQEGPRFVDATLFPNTVINSPAGFVSIFFGLGGPNTTIADGAASSLAALDYASTLLRRGRADAVLAGGFEELSPWVFLGLHNAGRLAVTGGEGGGSVPFARGRSGIAPGEGAAFLRLAASSPEPLAWITGQAAASAPGSLRAPQALDAAAARSAMVLAMRGALQSAGLGPEQVDAVWASAGGQPVLDALEAQALAEVFGARTAVLPVVAVKGALGECYGAAGALQVAAAVRGLQEGLLPPTAGEAPPDPDLGLGGLATRPRSLAAQHVLVNAFDGLGNNRSLVLSRAS